MLIDINKIEVGERLRSRLDPQKIWQLANDMERNGQLQEIVVAITWGNDSRSVERAILIAGYRRLEAAKLLGWTEIRCTRQLGGDIDTNSEVDLLRIEFSENELRENFTEMERVAFGVKLKERIAAVAKARMLAGKKADYEYDPETGYKVWRDDDMDATDEYEDSPDTDPPPNLVEGMANVHYDGGEVNDFVAREIKMSKEKFRQGEYVLKHGTEEQQAAINRGEASISGTYNAIRPKPQSSSVPKRAEAVNKNTSDVPLRKEPVAEPKTQREIHQRTATVSDEPTEQTPIAESPFEQRTGNLQSVADVSTESIPTRTRPEKPKATDTPAPKSKSTKPPMTPQMERKMQEEEERIRKVKEWDAMPPADKVVELEKRLKAEESRAFNAESELREFMERTHNKIYHAEGTIELLRSQKQELETALSVANARIKELEDMYEPK